MFVAEFATGAGTFSVRRSVFHVCYRIINGVKWLFFVVVARQFRAAFEIEKSGHGTMGLYRVRGGVIRLS